MSNKKNKSVRVVNASKDLLLPLPSVNNSVRASNYNLNRFEIIKSSFRISDLFKLKAICILIRKFSMCKHEDFDNTFSLFS